MLPLPTDTHPSAEERQIELLRAAGESLRFAATMAMSKAAILASREALRRLHPELGEREILRLWVSLHYGEDLAKRVFRPEVTSAGEIKAALRPVVEALERMGVPYMVAGSVASSLYGVPRTTLDADLVARIEGRHAVPFVEALGQDFYADEEMIRNAVRQGSSLNLIHQPSMVKIDVFPVRARPYDTHALGRRRRAKLDDLELFVATPEDVILSKLEWYERGDRVSERQWSDIRGLLRVHEGRLDLPYLRRWAADLGVGDLLDGALA